MKDPLERVIVPPGAVSMVPLMRFPVSAFESVSVFPVIARIVVFAGMLPAVPPLKTMPGARFVVALTTTRVVPEAAKVPAVKFAVPEVRPVMMPSATEGKPDKPTRIPRERPVQSATLSVRVPPARARATNSMPTVPAVTVGSLVLVMAVLVSIAPKVRVESALELTRVTGFESATVPPSTLLTTVPSGMPYP
jgi:hypothetical protein